MLETSPTSNTVLSRLWKIRLFGPLELERSDGHIFRPSGKKVGELLALLALQQDERMRREDLADRCWPESDPGRQRVRLRQEITALRAIFGDGSDSPLVVTKDYLQLRSDVTQVDTAQFEFLLEESRKSDVPSFQAEQLARATALYVGDLLTEYSNLFFQQRSDYMRRYETALRDLARISGALGNTAEAQEALQLLLAHNPLLEEAHADLMRLYAQLGQPSQVRRQFNELEHLLNREMGCEPTEATRRLRDSLLDGLQHPTSLAVPLEVLPEVTPSYDESSPIPIQQPFYRPQSSPGSPSRRVSSMAYRKAFGWIVISIALGSAGMFFTHSKQRTTMHASRPTPMIQWNKERWAYVDRPETTEMPNSEAYAATVTEDGDVIVTGQVETKKEDTDFLTVKLSPEGKVIWRNRYSSAGHDCDRARSIALDYNHGVYVAGESYLPALPNTKGIKEGWYATLVHYDSDGSELWSHYAPFCIEASQRTQVLTDGQGGAILAATEESKTEKGILFFHYSAQGKLLRQWKYSASGGANVSFVQMCTPSKGLLFACGKLVRKERVTAEGDSDWVTFCYDMDGKLRWEKFYDGAMHGNDSPSAIGCDRNGNAYVAGVFSIGHPDDETAALCPAVVKYNSDGQLQWLRRYMPLKGDVDVSSLTVSEDGSFITLAGKTLTPEHCFRAFALAYSGNGVVLQLHPNPLPANYRSSVGRVAYLMEYNRFLMIEAISPLSAEKFYDKTGIALNWSDMNGQKLMIYAYPRWNNKGGWVLPRDCFIGRDSVYICGRVPHSERESAFLVVGFPLPTR